jgi:hypothetical protein
MIKFTSILFVTLVFMSQPGFSQSAMNFEQYHVVSPGQPYSYMPVMHYQHARNWYAEARYNYEDAETFSLFLGRAFAGENNDLNFSFVPLLGGSVGRFNGISTGLNIDMDYNKFFFSSQSQYSKSTSQYSTDFLYSWSEVGYQSLKWFYAGLSVQHTFDRQIGNELQPGVMIGFTFNRFSIPVYTFDPFNSGRNFIVGLTMEWKHAKRKQPAFPVVKSDTPPVTGNPANETW